MEKKFDIFYFSGTHWDREWYQDFQGFRYRLERMVNRLLDILDKDDNFKTFHFDGQTIVLDDYTEICPEKKELLKKYINDGRILIGPWYVMPDEFLVSGESLIRNLMIGHEKAKEWGVEPWKYGYICDIFGHIAQMPQIFNGFSIDYSILGRGVNEADPAYFRWQSPDGSECINFKLAPDNGYGDFKAEVYDKEADKSVNNPVIIENIKKYVDRELERCDVPVVIIMDGLDHSEVRPETTEYLKALAELYPDASVHHVNLCEQGKMLESYRESLPVIEGELNRTATVWHGYLHLITNTLSSYYTVKKENDECQNLLEKTLEPLMFMAKSCGVRLNRNYVKLAYKNLIQNHPHDSICGCSIDQVHKDMEYRFAQVKEIGETLKNDFLYRVRRNGTGYETADKENILTVYNTLPFEVDKTVNVDFVFKKGYPIYNEPFEYEDINAFRIYDYDGCEIPYQVTEIKRDYIVREFDQFSNFYDVHKVTLRVKAPACGMAEYKIVPENHPVRYLKKLKSGSNYAENEFIRVNILKNGTLELIDKKSKKVYSNLCGFMDDGEIGDGWYHANPVNDTVVYSDGLSARIEKVESGPSRCVFNVTRYMEVPKEIPMDGRNTTETKKRSDETVTLKLKMTVALSEEAKQLDIKLSFDNIAKDHRLKLLLPTGIDSDRYFSGQAFYCCDRRVGIDYETQDWMEPEQYEKATNGIVGKRDENGFGLAFVSAKGIHECAAYDDEEGTIALTLLRAFRTTVMKNGETKCQLNIPLEYEFALVPLDNTVDYQKLVKVQDMMACHLMTNFVSVEENTALRKPESFMSVKGDGTMVSVIKEAESGDGLIVRVFNTRGENSCGVLEFKDEIESAALVNLNEECQKELTVDKNKLEFELEPWKIKTFKIKI